MNIDLPPQYDPHAVEAPIYKKWLDAKAFHAVARAPGDTRDAFSIVIPPPNVTGALHLGHAINGTIQDILTRYHRMKGDNTLWMPGIDHAGIATQAVVEKTIFEKEKKSRHDLGREELVRRIWEWKEQFGTRILSQLQSIGASADWDRTRFTLDETCAKAVREAFFKMFKDGLIFRGKRLVNWDTHLQTAVADDEIYHETVKGQMTSIKYPVDGSADEYLTVATTRPETMLGDTAVAVHPDDPRYTHLHGKFVIVPLVGRRIPIITDGQLVDPSFGTGVVKVTPAHDPNDYATGQRHHLEQINLLTADGKVNENGAGEFRGQKYSYTGLKFATAARKQVLADLEALGLVADVKVHEHEVGHSDRSKTPIEPYLSDQWFVRMGDIESAPTEAEPRPSGSVAPSLAQGGDAPDTTSETRPLGSVPPPPHSDALAYFLSFHTYATWLHGEDRGSVDPTHNTPGSDFIPSDPELLQRDAANLADPPFELSLEQRRSILNTFHEVAAFRGWTLHAINVRSNHVHAVVAGSHSPERMMNDFKSWATRRLREASLIAEDTKVWSRHGSTPYLWKQTDLSGAIDYVLNQQGANQPGTFFPDPNAHTLPHGRVSAIASRSREPSETRPSGSVGGGGIRLADGQHATGLAQAAMNAVLDGRVKITPDRYAKGYLDWLGQKRDWCISRQLWWGHRIPVWSAAGMAGAEQSFSEFETTLKKWGEQGRISYTGRSRIGGGSLDSTEEYPTWFICVRDENDSEVVAEIEKRNFIRDPDVLDTWFSSALWPISTMGWPNNDTTSETRPSGSVAPNSNTPADASQTLPHGRVSASSHSGGVLPEPGLLHTFYPTSVLSTARDILTLWVARMVMFGLYCHGDVPFKNVYVHPVIQDGDGKIMSKSKGNGVDPVDIIGSHGADALRFTLASLATETQDIRMPVTKDPKTNANTSPKFDVGRNFANKIWNASRFILTNIDESIALRGNARLEGATALALEDRWILSRLNATLAAATNAINSFHFADLAEALRTFFWTDLCDWYLEIAKARIKAGDSLVQSILLHCLETSLKLLHPMMPFITEELWSKLPNRTTLLINAPWPAETPLTQSSALSPQSFSDPAAEAQIAVIQSVTSAIREIQNRYPAARGKPVTLQPRDAATQATIDHSRLIIEALAAAPIAENTPSAAKPADAATAVLPDVQIFIGGVIDKAVELKKLHKSRDDLAKNITGSRNKLGNEAFVAKAPTTVVRGLRDQLARQEEELALVEKNIAELSA